MTLRSGTVAQSPNFSFLAKYKKGKFNDREEAERILRKIEGEEKANVIKAVGRKSTQRPPAPFNTTSFLKDATKLGLTASKAMSVAEDIYTRGFISYPRTDNTVYPKVLILVPFLSYSGLERYTESSPVRYCLGVSFIPPGVRRKRRIILPYILRTVQKRAN